MVGFGVCYESKPLAVAKRPVTYVLRVASEKLVAQNQLYGWVSFPLE